MSESLEWRLADLHWAREGVSPFVDGSVPYIINNSGSLSADAAAVLFANCVEAPPQDLIHIVEAGAGTGLFARYFLDEFQRLCERESRDYYRRLRYWATDRSPRAVEQWREREIFAPHSDLIELRACPAADAHELVPEPVRAVFANYVLDLLPSSILRHHDGCREQLYVRTSISSDPALLCQYTALTVEEIVSRAESSEEKALEELLPLLPLLESEWQFRPAAGREQPGPDATCFASNDGALECLASFARKLDPAGFILMNDFGFGHAPQRFGPAVAVGLNFEMLEQHFRARNVHVTRPGDDVLPTRARLLTTAALGETIRTFERRFDTSVRQQAEAVVQQARREAESGNLEAALAKYREAIQHEPTNWHLIGEAAAFIANGLRDYPRAIELAHTAVALNPWFSAWLWNVLGGALEDGGRPADAHECYLQAFRIHSSDAVTNLNLARSWLLQGNPGRCLEVVARGLAHDCEAMLRYRLLELQQRAIEALGTRWTREREVAARRSQQGCP